MRGLSVFHSSWESICPFKLPHWRGACCYNFVQKNVEKKTLFRFFGDIELVQGHAVGAHISGRLRLGQLWLKGQYHAVPLPTKLAGNRLDGGQRIPDRGSCKLSRLLSMLQRKLFELCC